MNKIKDINISSVPDGWVYKYYYEKHTDRKINQPFDGRLIKVRSFINNDSTPSLCFFYKKDKYFWRDFSEAEGGDKVKFVEKIEKKSSSGAMMSIVADYIRFINEGKSYGMENYEISEGSTLEYIPHVINYGPAHIQWWRQYKLDVKDLIKFSMFAMRGYKIRSSTLDSEVYQTCYGFFNNTKLYQIYQPHNTYAKYITIDSTYLKGEKELEFKHDTCAIVSGIKDMVCISKLNLACEYVAPVSETVLIGPKKIEFLKSKFKNIITILDPDPTGRKMMNIYKLTYDIKPVLITLSGDLAENNKNHDLIYLRDRYTVEINKAING